MLSPSLPLSLLPPLSLALSLLPRRYLSTSEVPVGRRVLQLVAMASLLLASKIEEVTHPTLSDFARMSANAFTPTEVRRMELCVLEALEYRVYSPTPWAFGNLIAHACPASVPTEVRALACYLAESAAIEYAFLAYDAHVVAGAAIMVARALLIAQPQCAAAAGKGGAGAPLRGDRRERGSGAAGTGSAAAHIKGGPWTEELAQVTGLGNATSGRGGGGLAACAALLARRHRVWHASDGSDERAVTHPLAPVKDKYSAAAWRFASAVPPTGAMECEEDFRRVVGLQAGAQRKRGSHHGAGCERMLCA